MTSLLVELVFYQDVSVSRRTVKRRGEAGREKRSNDRIQATVVGTHMVHQLD
jgi:hypothetical protein